MATIIDLLGSMIFGGALLLIILDANGNAIETQGKYAGDVAVQEALTGVIQRVEAEFRNIGFGVADTARSILVADSTSVTFLTCLDGSGTHIDTVSYSLGSTLELAMTQNELDRPLYRRQNSEPRGSVGTVTIFTLKYIDYHKSIIPTPVASASLKNIQEVEITVEVQNSNAEFRDQASLGAGERNALYSSSLWQQTRLASQNFKR